MLCTRWEAAQRKGMVIIMRKSHQTITYIFVDQDSETEIKRALQTLIIEKLLHLHREKLFAKN